MKTVKVKVCVAVDDEGNWFSAGSKRGNEKIDGVIFTCNEGLDFRDNQKYWLEAELRIPEIETIKANVKEIKE